MVEEEDAEVEGYVLTVTSSDDDGKVSVARNSRTEISFDNAYAEILLQLDDHFAYIIGYPDGTVRPEGNITRAETMKIVNRALDRHPHCDHLHDDMIEWVDNMDTSKWYYAEVQEATNSHGYVWIEEELEDWTEILPVRDWAALEKKWSDAYDG